jgi:hypothetical protein
MAARRIAQLVVGCWPTLRTALAASCKHAHTQSESMSSWDAEVCMLPLRANPTYPAFPAAVCLLESNADSMLTALQLLL